MPAVAVRNVPHTPGPWTPPSFGTAELVKGFSPASIPGLTAWYKADAITGLANGASIPQWDDQSGNGNHATQGTVGFQPTYATAGISGLPSVRFSGTASNQRFVLPSFAALTAATVFVVIKIDTDPPGAAVGTGLWDLGTDPTLSSAYPWTDGIIYDAFGTTARKTVGDPTPSLTSVHIYEVISGPGVWKSFLDGTPLFTTATNTVGLPASGTLGMSKSGTFFIDGYISEFVLFNGVLADSDRQAIEAYLTTRWFPAPAPSLSANDTLGTSDSASRGVQAFTRSASDSLGTTDTAARTQLLARSATDSLGTSDSAARAAATSSRSATDALATTDSAAKSPQAFTRTATDALSTTDSAARSQIAARAAADSLATTDAATRAPATRARTAADALNTSDAATRAAQSFARTASDTLATNDTAARATITRARTATDALATTDTTVRAITPARTASDSLNTTDAASRSGPRARTATDTLGTSDFAVRITLGTTVPDIPTILGLDQRQTLLTLGTRSTLATVDTRATNATVGPRQTAVSTDTRTTTATVDTRATRLPLDPRTTAVTIDG